jgi:hypothetical protein
MDQINRRFPKMLSIAATGVDKSWQPKTERISQRYTTDWKDLVVVIKLEIAELTGKRHAKVDFLLKMSVDFM